MDKNLHITEYLTRYIEMKNPGFAVLLKGEWGAGKTWFIDKFLDSKAKSHKFVKISCYGLVYVEEIDLAIFREIHPKLSSKAAGITGKLVSATLKHGVQLDLDGLWGSIFQKKISLSPADNYVFIFDDVERSHIEPQVLLGYLNQLVEIEKQNVIILGDEVKLLSKSDQSSEFTYQNIKEKLIGKQFSVKSDVDHAIDYFISERSVDFFDDNKNVVKKVYKLSGKQNLRLIKYALIDFEYLYSLLNTDNRQAVDKVSELFELYLILYIELNSGRIGIEIITGLFDYSYIFSLDKEDPKRVKYEELQKRYRNADSFNSSDLIFSKLTWIDILDRGICDREKINGEFGVFVGRVEKVFWVKLIDFWNYSSEECRELQTQAENILLKGNLNTSGELLQVISTLMYFTNKGLYSKSIEEIDLMGRNCIDLMAKNGVLNNEAVIPRSHIRFHDAYGGYIFLSKDELKFKEIIEYSDQVLLGLAVKNEKLYAEKLEALIVGTQRGYEPFFENQNFDFNNLPFLRFISASKIAFAITNQAFNINKPFFDFLNDRYANSVSSEVISQEREFVSEFVRELHGIKNQNEGTLKVFLSNIYIDMLNTNLNLESD